MFYARNLIIKKKNKVQNCPKNLIDITTNRSQIFCKIDLL